MRMCLISAIMNFYWSHAIPLQKLSNERSYKFSWILTLTEVITIRNVRFDRQRKWRSLNAADPKTAYQEIIRYRRQTLRSNTDGCELKKEY